MRMLLLSLLLLLGRPAAAEGAARWEEVLLLDWVYPGEANYQALQSAATQTGTQNWIVQRMGRGEKIPQASARELAWRLASDTRLDQASRERLKELFADEAQLLKETGAKDYSSKAGSVSAQFDALSHRMDEIDEIFQMNNYGKGNVPSVTMETFTGYNLNSPAGMMSGSTKPYLLGGIVFRLSGTLDKANYSVSLGGSIDNNDGAWATSIRRSGAGTGFSFVLPVLGNGLEVHLGDQNALNFSHLIFSLAAAPINDLFFLDFSTAFRPLKQVKEATLGYPSVEGQIPGLFIRQQGFSGWWPFSSTQFIYAPLIDFWETYTAKFNFLGLRVDEELGPRWDIFDNIVFYGVYLGSGNDLDQVRSLGLLTASQSTSSYAFGLKAQLTYGSSLNFEGAVSNFVAQSLPIGSFDFGWNDSAYVATLAQPVGPFYLGLESAMAGPHFITGGLVGGALQSGATLSSNQAIPWSTKNYPDNMGWISNIGSPQLLVNNTQRIVAKTQWTGSWISVGLYEGVVNEINPTMPFVMTKPFIEGFGANGYGWFRMLGALYLPVPPLPFSPDPGGPSHYIWAWNRPTDGNAITPVGGGMPIHWHEINSKEYRSAQMTVALTKDGVKDPRLMAETAKVTNYAGGTLKLDFKSLFTRTLPFEIAVTGEVRDLGLQAGIPALDDSNLFSQQVAVGYLVYGLTETVDLIGMLGTETWKTKKSFYPMFAQIREIGAGTDFNLDPFLTGLKLNVRSTWYSHEDLMNAGREFTLWTLSVGSTLTY